MNTNMSVKLVRSFVLLEFGKDLFLHFQRINNSLKIQRTTFSAIEKAFTRDLL